MKLLQDNKAESVIEVGFVVMLMILVMSFLVLTMGTFLDKFMAVMESIRVTMPLGTAWGIAMWNLIPVRFASWFFLVPGFFILVIIIWGIKTVIKRHQYSTQDTQYINNEEY